jgi:hypothetical protein
MSLSYSVKPVNVTTSGVAATGADFQIFSMQSNLKGFSLLMLRTPLAKVIRALPVVKSLKLLITVVVVN